MAALEDYLLGSLAVEPRVFILMAGRGRPYPWKTPELRLKAEFIDLEPFPELQTTKEQLKRQQKRAVPRAAQIHKLSGGNPLANFLLAAHKDLAAALDQVVDEMLGTVPEEHRGRVREYFEALCVLRAFDEAHIPVMLAAYYDDDTYRDWSYAQGKRVREELVRWGFAKWSDELGGYVPDEPVKRIAEHYLGEADKDKWRRLHHAAAELYEDWAQKYPRTSEWLSEEAEYHRRKIEEGGV